LPIVRDDFVVDFIAFIDSFVSCFSPLQGTLHGPVNQDNSHHISNIQFQGHFDVEQAQDFL
jgi:hypothetical protein